MPTSCVHPSRRKGPLVITMNEETIEQKHVVTEFDLSSTPYEDHTHGETVIHEYLSSKQSGASYVSLLLTHADVLIGSYAFSKTQPKVPVTVDMTHRQLAKLVPGTYVSIDSRILRIGNAAIVGEVIFSANDTVVATTHVTFSLSPRPQDSGSIDLPLGVTRHGKKPIMDLHERLALRVIELGVVEVDLTAETINASKGLQGGLTAFTAEYAAESLLRPDEHLIDCDIRYLSGVRAGPGQARAKRIAPNLIRVEVVDLGKDDRVCVITTFRTGAWQ